MTKPARTVKPTKIPGLPGIPADASPGLRRYLEAVSEALEIRLGRRGDKRDRAVTLRELIDSGLALELAKDAFDPNNPSTDIGNPNDNDGGTEVEIPTQPTGFSATGGYELISLFWDVPYYRGHSLTEVWRHDADILGDAVLVGVSSGRSFVDSVGEDASYYYWIRHVNVNEVAGVYNSADGTLAETAANVDLLLDVLEGAITDSALADSLSSRIDLVDGAVTVPGSVAAQIAAEASARASAISTAVSAEASARSSAISTASASLQSQINDLVGDISAYSSTTTYAQNDLVTYNDYLYRAKQSTTGNLPTNTTYWTSLGEYTSLSEVVANNSSAITALNNVSTTSDSAAAVAIAQLEATVDDTTTGLAATRATLLTDYSTTSNMNTAISNAVTGLASTTDLDDYVTSSHLTTNYRTETDTDTAISTAVTGLASTTDLADYVQTTYLTQNYRTETDTDTAISTAITGLASTTDLADYVQTSYLTQNYTTTTDMTSAISQATTGLASTTDLDDYVTSSHLTTNYLTSTDVNSAISTATTGLASTTDLDDYVTSSHLTTNYLTATDVNSAISTATTGLASTTDLDDYVTSSHLTTNYLTATDTNSAISTATTGLASTTDLDDYVTSSHLTTNYLTTTDVNSAISTATTGLASTTDLDDYVTSSHLTTNYLTATDTNSAISTATTGLASTTDLDDYVTSSHLTTNYSTTTDVNSAISTATTGLASTTDLGDYVTSAFLESNYTTSTDMTSAISTATTGLVASSTLDNYSTTAAIEQSFYAQADGEDLEAQYTVKVDLNGAVAGFGLASTTNAAGNITSEFIVNADRFAIMRGGSDTTAASVPFSVVTSEQTVGGETVPAGVYMSDAFIKNGTITNAKIANLAVDNGKIANLSADKINAGTIDTSLLNIDDVTLTANEDGALAVDAINANQITAGSISATVMQGTTVYANRLLGDVSIMRAFRNTDTQSFAGGAATIAQGGTLTFLEVTLPATTHTSVGHIPYAQASGWFNSTNSKTYSIKMWMKDNSTASTSLGSPTSVGTTSSKTSTLVWMVFSGDIRSYVAQGNVLTAGSKTGSVTSALYNTSSDATTVYYTPSGSAFTTSDTISVSPSGNYQLVGETRFKATTNLYMSFSLSGTLGLATTGSVDMKLEMTRTGSSGVGDADTGTTIDSIGEVSGMIMGMR